MLSRPAEHQARKVCLGAGSEPSLLLRRRARRGRTSPNGHPRHCGLAITLLQATFPPHFLPPNAPPRGGFRPLHPGRAPLLGEWIVASKDSFGRETPQVRRLAGIFPREATITASPRDRQSRANGCSA